VTIVTPAKRTAPGYLLLAPFDITGTAPSTNQHGPLIVDNTGQPVWFHPLGKLSAMDLRVQSYLGKPVLTWYEGQVLGPYGGSFVIADRTYRQLIRVRAGHGYRADLHELLITSRGTALISIYNQVQADLSEVGGPPDGQVVEGIVQELELPSGRVLFEWHSLDHVAVEESFQTELTRAGNVDYFHLNSIAVDRGGDLLVSARNTSAVYKVDRTSGEVLWRLGGKRSDFQVEPDASYSFQHDARAHADGTITIFDNAAAEPPTEATGLTTSRPIRIALDTDAMTARLVDLLVPPDPRLAWAMGNMQQLPDGGSLVGWGTAGPFTEFTPTGEVRLDGRFADGSVTYRAYRFPWLGHPAGKPAIAVRRKAGGTIAVYVSWNGATEVARWQVRAGPAPNRLAPLRTSRRTGFETAITVRSPSGYVAVAALGSFGHELGRSRAIRV
jgi:Arylsulfotransferase (ASST)